jgi:hypothetical protein
MVSYYWKMKLLKRLLVVISVLSFFIIGYVIYLYALAR